MCWVFPRRVSSRLPLHYCKQLRKSGNVGKSSYFEKKIRRDLKKWRNSLKESERKVSEDFFQLCRFVLNFFVQRLEKYLEACFNFFTIVVCYLYFQFSLVNKMYCYSKHIVSDRMDMLTLLSSEVSLNYIKNIIILLWNMY